MDAQQTTSEMSPAQAALWESFTGSTWDMADTWSLLREQEPVAFIPALNMWAVSRHEDVVVLLRDYERFGHLPAEVMGPVPDDLAPRLPTASPCTRPPSTTPTRPCTAGSGSWPRSR